VPPLAGSWQELRLLSIPKSESPDSAEDDDACHVQGPDGTSAFAKIAKQSIVFQVNRVVPDVALANHLEDLRPDCSVIPLTLARAATLMVIANRRIAAPLLS
jgi:hypothetical protein